MTVAGTVGHWWFEPAEANSFCSSAVTNAFIRTVTTSFGSICFGSLIVAILEALRMLARFARDNDDGNGILLCLAECCLSCMASIMEYFNKVSGLHNSVLFPEDARPLTLFPISYVLRSLSSGLSFT